MLHVTLTVTLTLKGPILTRSTAADKPGVDAPMARDSQDRFYLPFSLVRGRLRQSWEELSVKQDDLDRWLGSKSSNQGGGGYEPQRARLRFTDFICAKNVKDPEIAYRIKIDPERFAAKQGALWMQESPFKPEEAVEFTGEIQFCAADQTEANAITDQVRCGLRWITNFGAERTAGFGRLSGVDIQVVQKPVAQASASVGTSQSPVGTAAPTTSRWGLVFRPLAPFCIAKKLPIANVFESDSTISGGVLKGALALALKAVVGLSHNTEIDGLIPAPWNVLGHQFARVRFTHAFPSKRGCRSRPTQPPLSLVKDGSSTLHDIALLNGPVLLGNPPSAPAFAIDWKDSSDVRKTYGWVKPGRELRVRTAIDRDLRRAKDEQLFAYEMIDPTDHEWLAILDLSYVDAADLPDVENRLRDLLSSGLLAIGKTKARIEVDMIPESQLTSQLPSTPAPLAVIGCSQWIVTLQTLALVCDPFQLDETSGEAELRKAYSDVWTQLSGGALSLVRFFASQSLMGRYLVERFQDGKPYNPFLLTDAGSVFVLEALAGQESLAQAKIDAWLQSGLPLPDWAVQRYGDTWKTCPFRPVDGFGEIAVNLPCHTAPTPQEAPFHVIS